VHIFHTWPRTCAVSCIQGFITHKVVFSPAPRSNSIAFSFEHKLPSALHEMQFAVAGKNVWKHRLEMAVTTDFDGFLYFIMVLCVEKLKEPQLQLMDIV
jgi:hypothetical protein